MAKVMAGRVRLTGDR